MTLFAAAAADHCPAPLTAGTAAPRSLLHWQSRRGVEQLGSSLGS